MKSKYLTLFLLIGGIIFLASCDKYGPCVSGHGSIVSQSRSVSGFTGISFESEGTVYVSQGSSYSLTIEAQQNIIDDMRTEVNGDELQIYNHHCLSAHDQIKVYVTLPDPQSVKLSGAGDIILLTPVHTSSLDLSLSGSGNITSMDSIVATDVSTDISGSGNIDVMPFSSSFALTISGSGSGTISGHATSQTIDMSASGDVHAFGLESDVCIVHISGSGNAEVWVNNYLDVEISGSGNVYYKGFPVINVSVSGSGQLISSN